MPTEERGFGPPCWALWDSASRLSSCIITPLRLGACENLRVRACEGSLMPIRGPCSTWSETLNTVRCDTVWCVVWTCPCTACSGGGCPAGHQCAEKAGRNLRGGAMCQPLRTARTLERALPHPVSLVQKTRLLVRSPDVCTGHAPFKCAPTGRRQQDSTATPPNARSGKC